MRECIFDETPILRLFNMFLSCMQAAKMPVFEDYAMFALNSRKLPTKKRKHHIKKFFSLKKKNLIDCYSFISNEDGVWTTVFSQRNLFTI